MSHPIDDVVDVAELPQAYEDDFRTVRHGFAAALDGEWFWFPSIVPAFAFVRAGRMSVQVSSISLLEAVLDERIDERSLETTRILILRTGGNLLLEARRTEKELVRVFAAALDPQFPGWVEGPGAITARASGKATRE